MAATLRVLWLRTAVTGGLGSGTIYGEYKTSTAPSHLPGNAMNDTSDGGSSSNDTADGGHGPDTCLNVDNQTNCNP